MVKFIMGRDWTAWLMNGLRVSARYRKSVDLMLEVNEMLRFWHWIPRCVMQLISMVMFFLVSFLMVNRCHWVPRSVMQPFLIMVMIIMLRFMMMRLFMVRFMMAGFIMKFFMLRFMMVDMLHWVLRSVMKLFFIVVSFIMIMSFLMKRITDCFCLFKKTFCGFLLFAFFLMRFLMVSIMDSIWLFNRLFGQFLLFAFFV